MTYLNNLLHYLIKASYTYPIYITLFILFFTQVALVYQLLFKQKVTRDIKIYNFTLNTFYILSYISIFIILLFTLRYIRWGYTIELHLLYTNISNFYDKVPLIVSLNFFALILIIFLFILKIKTFLHIEILKRHLYYYYYIFIKSHIEFRKKETTKLLKGIDYLFYVRLCRKLKTYWNYADRVDRFIYDIISNILTFCGEYIPNFNKNYYPLKLEKYLQRFLLLLPKIILVILFIYDCIYNHFNIHLIFYYLPFYLLFALWFSVTTFLKKTSDTLNHIIYERYYEENNVKYINTTNEEDTYIFRYIARHCRCFSHDIEEKDQERAFDKLEAIFAFPQIFKYNRRFVRVDNTNVFRNPKTGDEVLEEDFYETNI